MHNAIILIGMSGVGKSYHTRFLKKHYLCKVFAIDDLIASALNEGDVHDVAKFLGPPYGEHYALRSKHYLDLEEKFTKQALEYAKTHSQETVIIDTTGSLVHLSAELLSRVKKCENTVFLDVDETYLATMVELYLKDPKPVIWGDLALEFSEDTYKETVERLYPKLLATRRGKYQSLSRAVISYKQHKRKGFDIVKHLHLKLQPKSSKKR